ncbi:hypothetical protein L1887_08381 [Cichorium endivia]|nr:hypothetical protein L1887_08381 [Cichorium endivia]
MPQKDYSKNSKKERTPAYPLRRSPRFLEIVLPDPEDPRTPKPEPRRRTRVPSSTTPLNFTGNWKVSPRWKSLRSNSKECTQKPDESCNATQSSDNSKPKSRRFTTPTPCAEECTGEKSSRSSKRRNRKSERQVTRSSSHKDCSLGERITEDGVNTSKKCNSKLLKNKVKHSKKSHENNSDPFKTLALDDNPKEGFLSIIENPTLNEELPEKCVAKVTTPSIDHNEPTNKRDINKKTQKNTGVKRKRNQLEGISGITHGWTKDQESALERAYLQAKPTPQFWKRVSKLVPGKSAQECFDKIHGGHLTPPRPRLRCRARIPNSHDPTLSASKFLSSSSPTTKKPKSRKQKSHIIQRTVRHMLQNQYKEQEPEPDLFSVLEPTFTQSLNHNLTLSTPVRTLDMDVVLKRSSTVHKKSLSRFSETTTTLVSPPVLKQVKNRALHEKYIDQLHCREESRKVASKKAGKCSGSEGVKGESSGQRKDAFKAAKNALVFGARDAISEFECKQGMALIDVFEDECVDDDEDGGQLSF